MDLQGKAATIPDSAAVLVNVAKLSELEKALILYRHARAANLDMEAKEVLKSHVKLIVTDGSFSPERIRRFVQESLPALVASVRSGKSKDQMIRQEIHEALRNPTERMVKSCIRAQRAALTVGAFSACTKRMATTVRHTSIECNHNMEIIRDIFDQARPIDRQITSVINYAGDSED